MVFIRNDLKPELTFTWQSNDKFKEPVQQTIGLFTQVNILLSKHDSDILKFNITLKHPNEEACTITNNKKHLNDDLIQIDNLYNQRIDTDPYTCD